MNRPSLLALAIVAGSLLACSGGGGRELNITATDQGCSPSQLTAETKEKLTFVVKNEARTDRELEGEDGTELEEVLIPSGKTRKINFTTRSDPGSETLKCYIPGGPETIIKLQVTN
jgi:cupredoxin-like protein